MLRKFKEWSGQITEERKGSQKEMIFMTLISLIHHLYMKIEMNMNIFYFY